MSELEKMVASREEIAPSKSYVKPKVTTFGSVAELTMGGTGTKKDGMQFKHA